MITTGPRLAFEEVEGSGPAYEFAFIVDADLRKRKIRHKFPMTYVTSEPYIGHLGLGGVGDSKSMLESELRKHHIKWITNAKTTKVEDGKLYCDELDAQGSVAWFKKGKWVHTAKIAFEKYFINKMKKGTSEPLYEKYILKMLSIEKLEK